MSDQTLSGFPASRQQQRLFELCGGTSRGNYLVLKIINSTDETRLQQIILDYVEEQENLKTQLVKNSLSKFPLQELMEEAQVQFKIHSCTNELEAKQMIVRLSKKNFFQDSEESIRFDLIKGKDLPNYLLISASRFFSDFNSLQGLAKHLADHLGKDTSTLESDEDALQYIDFSEWQRELLQSKESSGFQYWGRLDTMNLAFNRIFKINENKEETASTIEQSNAFIIPLEQIQTLKEFAENKATNLQSVLLTIWWKLLQEYAPQAVSLAYKYDGRTQGQTDAIFGLFEKYLPIPSTIFKEESSIWEMAKKLDLLAKEQQMHQEYFHLGFNQQAGQECLFPYQFAYYTLPKTFDDGSNSIQLEDFYVQADECILKLELYEQGENWLGRIHYQANTFSVDWINSFREQFLQMITLELMEEQYDVPTRQKYQNDLALTFQRNINSLFSKVNTDLTLLDLLESAPLNHPNKMALIYEEEELSFKNLHIRANQLAHLILERTGNVAESIIGVQLSNPIEAVVAFLAILKSGNAYLPIDINTPALRMAYLLEQSEAVLFINDQDWTAATFSTINLPLATIQEKVKDYSTQSPSISIRSKSPCYLIYTSGTTGNPKGVLIPHNALVNYLQWFTKKQEVNELDRTVLFSSMAFDLGLTILWSALTAGAELHLIHPTQSLSFLENVNAFFVEKQITYIKCTPSHFKLILGDAEFEKFSKQQQIRLVFLGGEQIDAVDVSTYLKHRKETLIVNEYGPTETTIGVIAKEIKTHTIDVFKQLPLIGIPFAGHQVYILDDLLNPVLPGQYGTLYLTGPGLALGYINEPELTSKAFHTLPFENDSRLFYATGDLGRWLPNGDIQLAGRKDNQVKIRGYRIELEEITQSISKMEAVKSAYTMIGKMTHEEMGLRSFIVFSDNQQTTEAIHQFLEDRLPSYMIPDQFFVLDAIPLTQNGKVDQEALDVFAATQLEQATLVLPLASDEKIIAEIWKTLLGLEQIGVHQNFFQQGGHSLLGMKMLSRVQKQLNVRVQLTDFFQQPTIAALVNLVRNAQKIQIENIKQLTASSNQDGCFELSTAQQRIWMQEQLKAKDGAYNIYFACWIKGNLSIEKMEHCLNLLARRHENLRTNFIEIEGKLKQKIIAADAVDFKIEYIDQRHCGMDKLEAVLIDKCKEGFDLEKEHLFRCIWLDTVGNVPLLIFNFHHIIMDEWSLNIFENELIALLNAEESAAVELPHLPIQYKDFAAWEQSQLKADYLRQMQLFFESQFAAPLPQLNLATDWPRQAERSFTGHSLVFEIQAEIANQILDFCEKESCSLFEFLMAVSKVFLFRLSNQTDIIVGTLEANRNHPDLENVIGCFFNILPVRSQFNNEDSFVAFLKQVKHRLSATLNYALYPFDYLLRDLDIHQTPGRSPIFDVMISMRTMLEGYGKEQQIGDLKIAPFQLPSLYSKYDLLLDFVREEKGMQFIIEYNTSLFKESTINEYFQIFEFVLATILKDPKVRLNEIGADQEWNRPIEEPIDTFFNF